MQLMSRFLWVVAIVVATRSSPGASSAAAGDKVVAPNPAAIADPTAGGEQLPSGYRTLLERDQIAPVYNPVFTAAASVDWPQDSLVIGVAAGEDAKAYPVTHLNSREMVIDSLAGIPILVTW